MSLRHTVLDQTLDLPPPYNLVILREAGDAFAHACAIAEEAGAGTLVWVRRFDHVELAVVLEPEDCLSRARRAHYAGMNALASALATHAPPSKPVTFDWPDAIRVDGVLVGGARLGFPADTRNDETPAWLVFSTMIRTTVVHGPETGMRPLTGALDEVGFENISAEEIIASFSRHLMAILHEWSEDGFDNIARTWLGYLPSGERDFRIDDDGNLCLKPDNSQSSVGKRSLADGLLTPTWLDPETAMPWL